MKKLLPSFMLIFVLVISCISAVKAQVMEMVSYTPSPSGSYNTISAKGDVQLAGDLNAPIITAVGEQLDLTVTTALNNGSATSFTSGKDIYKKKALTSIGSLGVYQGQLNINAGNTSITGAIAGNPIMSANTVSMSGVNVNLSPNGVLMIDNVPMTNPNCQIKWVNLPAYRLNEANEEETDEYYFATCDDVPDYDENQKYSCSYGPYQACPCGQIETTNGCKRLRAYINETPAIATCTSGFDNTSALWDETVQDTEKKCEFTSSGSAWTSQFRCSSITMQTCKYPYYYTNEYSGLRTSAEMANPRKIYVRDTNASAPAAQCGGALRSAADVAKEFYYTDDPAGTNAGSYISYPIQQLNIPSDQMGSLTQTQLNDFKTSTFAMYCGFNSVPEILDAMQNNPHCTTSGNIGPCPNSILNNANKNFLTPAELCSMVPYASFNSSNNYECALDYPNNTDFQAYRVINYNITSQSVNKCETCNANGHNYCKNTSTNSYNVANTSSAWIKVNSVGHAEYTAAEILATSPNKEKLLGLTTATHYLNRKITTRVLSCHIY